MASNPLIPQGVLNRLRAQVTIPAFPNLNVTASFLGEEGISLALEGTSSTQIRTLAGVVQSPEPYMAATITIQLLKTQSLAAQFKAQMEDNVLIGDVTVIPDASSLPNYQLSNCSISDIREQRYSGRDAGWMVIIGGFYILNNALWNLT